MTDRIGSFDSEREFAFPLTSIMKALRNSPVETLRKIFGNEGIKAVSGSCGSGVLWPWWTVSRISQRMLGSHFRPWLHNCRELFRPWNGACHCPELESPAQTGSFFVSITIRLDISWSWKFLLWADFFKICLQKELVADMADTIVASFILYYLGPSSQGYGFSSGHVWVWELDYKDSWALKNWCFWTVLVEKTLERPLDCKEIQAVHPKGDQSWVFIGRTDAEAETPILWPPDVKSWLIGKDPDARKDWGQEKGMTEDEIDGWMASPTQWTWVWVDSGSWWWTGRPGVLQFMGSQRVRHDWATELNCNWLNTHLWTPGVFCRMKEFTVICKITSNPAHQNPSLRDSVLPFQVVNR